MIRTVVWRNSAERELAELWANSRMKNAIAEATDRIDKTLRERADLIGESRTEDYRIHFDPPLAITYRIIDADQIVEVVEVWVTSEF